MFVTIVRPRCERLLMQFLTCVGCRAPLAHISHPDATERIPNAVEITVGGSRTRTKNHYVCALRVYGRVHHKTHIMRAQYIVLCVVLRVLEQYLNALRLHSG